MKTKRIKLLLISLLLTLLCTLLLACTPTLPKLSAPEILTFSDGNIAWLSVPNATGYLVQIDNAPPVEVHASQYSAGALPPGAHEARVMAIGKAETYADSDWSQVYRFTIIDTILITFDAQSGQTNELSRGIEKGAAIGTLPAATRANYTFLGWFTQPNGGGTQASSASTIAAPATLYAHWQIETVTVTLDTQGGATLPSLTVNKGAAVGVLPSATRANYTFLGWRTQPNGQGTAVSASTTFSENATIYANWQTE